MQGPDLYQVWLGGSPNQDGRTGWAWKEKMKQSDLEATLEPVLTYWRDARTPSEAFGDFTNRVVRYASPLLHLALALALARNVPTDNPFF